MYYVIAFLILLIWFCIAALIFLGCVQQNYSRWACVDSAGLHLMTFCHRAAQLTGATHESAL